MSLMPMSRLMDDSIQIAKLAGEADDQAQADQQDRAIQRRAGENRVAQRETVVVVQTSAPRAPDMVLLGLVWGTSFGPPIALADDEGTDIVEPDRAAESSSARATADNSIVRHIAEMREPGAEQEEPEYPQADALPRSPADGRRGWRRWR